MHRFSQLMAVAVLLVSSCVAAGQATPVLSDVSRLPAYQRGERLSYVVSMSSFPTAAHVELWNSGPEMIDGRELIGLHGTITTTDTVGAALISIDRSYTTYIDPGNGQPQKSIVVIKDNGTPVTIKKDSFLPRESGSKSGADKATIVYDLLSAAYLLRSFSFEAPGRQRIAIDTEAGSLDVKIKVMGREMQTTNAGRFDTIVLQLDIAGGNGAIPRSLQIYVSADSKHVPVLAVMPGQTGEVRAELASFDMLAPQPDNRPPGKRPIEQIARTGGPGTAPGSTITAAEPNSGPRPATAALPVPVKVPAPPTAGRGPDSPPVAEANPATAGPGVASTPRRPPNVDQPRVLTPRLFPSDLPFSADEKLNYTVFLEGTQQPVGIVSLQVKGRNYFFGRDGLRLSATAETAIPGQQLFQSGEQIESYVDPLSLAPFHVDLGFKAERSSFSDAITFNQDASYALTAKGVRVGIPVPTYDLLSIVYALRSQRLAPGARIPFTVFWHGEAQIVLASVDAKQTVQIGSQQISALVVSLKLERDPVNAYGLQLWLSDDRRRLPLRLRVKTSAGVVTADLALGAAAN